MDIAVKKIIGKDTQCKPKSQYEDNLEERGTFARDDLILRPPSESKLLDTYLKCDNQVSNIALLASNNYGTLTVAFTPSESLRIQNLNNFDQRNLCVGLVAWITSNVV